MAVGEIQPVASTKHSQQMLSPLLRISLLLGVCVHLLGFLAFRVISTPLPVRDVREPFVRYVSPEILITGAELEEQAVLFDSAPLFVPGRWNAAHNLNPPFRDRTLLRFPAYEPKMDPSSALLPESLPIGLDYAVESPQDLLALRFWDTFEGIASATYEPTAMPTTGTFLEVRSLSGSLLKTRTVELDDFSAQVMEPIVFYIRVEAAGRAVGHPTLSQSSGDAAFDASAYNWLRESGISADLPPGLFEIRIYP